MSYNFIVCKKLSIYNHFLCHVIITRITKGFHHIMSTNTFHLHNNRLVAKKPLRLLCNESSDGINRMRKRSRNYMVSINKRTEFMYTVLFLKYLHLVNVHNFIIILFLYLSQYDATVIDFDIIYLFTVVDCWQMPKKQ